MSHVLSGGTIRHWVSQRHWCSKMWVEVEAREGLPLFTGLREGVVHELLHLKVPNHGKGFRTLFRECLAETSRYKLEVPLALKSFYTLPRYSR